MALRYKFNPIYGKLDLVDIGSPNPGTSPGGSDTEIQFNDNGSFGGDSRFLWDKNTGTFANTGDSAFNTATFNAGVNFQADVNINVGPLVFGTVVANINLNSTQIALNNGLGHVATLETSLLTGDHTYSFPDKAGTFAMLSDIPSTSGFVVGPASAVNNHVAFFDGTTGKLIKDSGLTLSGSNTGDITVVDTASIDFTLTGQFLTASVLPAGVDHNSLANLTTGDPHTQYALLAGRSGGQTLNGGTAAGNNLTLFSTANATKGKILFGTSAYDEVNNRLGLGTNAPNEQLELTGNLRFPGTSATGGAIFQGTKRILHWYGSQNFFVGPDVGNITLTGSANFAMGDTVMKNLTSGSDNVAMGVAAMRDITIGTANIGLGSNALIQLTGGSKNVGIGNFSGFGIKTNNSNVALGYAALAGSLTGDSNIGLGERAGQTVTSGTFNLLLGDHADVSAGTFTNAISIGKNAVASASNTGVLGATGTDAVLFGVAAGQSASYAKIGGTLFDHFVDAGNSTTTETDLYSDTIPANTLIVNGHKLEAEYGGVFVSSATATREVKIYFAGTVIFDTGALTLSLSSAWTAYVTLIRVSSTVVRYMISFTTEGAALAAYTAVGELTGLTLTGNNILKITGQAAGVGASSGDVTAKMATISWFPAS